MLDEDGKSGPVNPARPELEQALHHKALAEHNYNSGDLNSAIENANRAHELCPSLMGLSELLTNFRILSAAGDEKETPDYYAILQVERFSDINLIKKQYKRLALTLHPGKNAHVASEAAFKLVGEAARVLSDTSRRNEYDLKLRVSMQSKSSQAAELGAGEGFSTFSTVCSSCGVLNQQERMYLGQNLVCSKCKKSFKAMEVGEGRNDVGNEGEGIGGGQTRASARIKEKIAKGGHVERLDLGVKRGRSSTGEVSEARKSRDGDGGDMSNKYELRSKRVERVEKARKLSDSDGGDMSNKYELRSKRVERVEKARKLSDSDGGDLSNRYELRWRGVVRGSKNDGGERSKRVEDTEEVTEVEDVGMGNHIENVIAEEKEQEEGGKEKEKTNSRGRRNRKGFSKDKKSGGENDVEDVAIEKEKESVGEQEVEREDEGKMNTRGMRNRKGVSKDKKSGAGNDVPSGKSKSATPSISQSRKEKEVECTFDYSRNENEQEFERTIDSSRNGDILPHHLVVHYGDCEFHENDFSEDSSFLDILSVCKKFIDIYSVGFKITDGDGRPLKNDTDVTALLMRHEGVHRIDIYIDEDPTARPLSFKLPQDNPMLALCIPSTKVTNVKILGDLKAKKKIKVSGTVVGGIEEESMVELFITISKSFDAKNDLEAIGQFNTNKEFRLPVKAVGHYVVAKYSPMNADGKYGEPVFVVSDTTVKNPSPRKGKKGRGANKVKKVASLRSGEKLDVIFFNNRPVDKNHEAWSRHLGKIVRDSNLCPVRVQTWKEIGNEEKQRMWEAVKERFANPNIEFYREHTLEHMGVLWGAWRSKLYADHVKPYKNKKHALKKVPHGMNYKDWEWLVTNKFLTKEFQEASERNSKNRIKSERSMPHLTGSKPYREIIYEKGGKDSEMPDLGVIFYETHSKNGKFKGTKEKEKYEEIVKTVQSNPSLPNFVVAEKCFGPQRHGHVFGYGGGVKRKTFGESLNATKLLEKLHAKEEENRLLRKRMDGLEERLNRLENELTELPEESPTAADSKRQKSG